MNKHYGMWLGWLTALTLAACGGDDASTTDTAQALAPGSTYQQEVRLDSGGTIVSRYVVHGVTPQGELVATDRPDLLPNRLVPLLESETLEGRSAPQASEPTALVQQQRIFFKQVWDAYAALHHTSDPAHIVREIADLDARMVDLMDDSAASGVALADYLSLFEPLDQAETVKDLAYVELVLQEALTQGVKGSTLDPAPAACAVGAEPVTSQSGISWYCQPAPMKASPASQSNIQTKTASSDSFKERIDYLQHTTIRLNDFIRQIEAELQKYRSEIETLKTKRQQLRSEGVAINKVYQDLNVRLHGLALKHQDCTADGGLTCSADELDGLNKEIDEVLRAADRTQEKIQRNLSETHKTENQIQELSYRVYTSQNRLDQASAESTDLQNQMRRLRDRWISSCMMAFLWCQS